ncbi:unnamed protein product [Rotaria socialis]|uniref:Transposase n=2 Tax=Rotaria socialis TaxID=392032 RepID=A0A821H0D8_9BILA|nr:unnamed protein product [Rotaria socialis]CAF4675744.1 unnamed protein product [Rotaria socialis]
MKCKDLQQVVFRKYEDGDGPTKIFRDLSGSLGLATIKRWCKMIRDTGSIQLSKPPGGPRFARTSKTIQKVKHKLNQKKMASVRSLAKDYSISKSSSHRILKEDMKLYPYKMRIEPKLTEEHKNKRKKFVNWVGHNFRKEDTMRILFSDEKIFDLDGMYNSQNQRIWAVSRDEADEKGGIKVKQKFPQKVMVWLGVCSKGVTPLVIFDSGTVDHAEYIQKVLPVALKYGNKTFGKHWTFQQDGAKRHIHHLTQTWCQDNFPSFIDKDHWSPNSPDLNPLDYCIWDEFAQCVNWKKVTSKATLIDELKCAVEKIRQDVVLQSCSSWTARLSRVLKNGGGYLKK